MRIAYLVTWSGDQRTGVFKKVLDQVSSWASLGAEPAIFVATTPESAAAWRSIPHTVSAVEFRNAAESFWVQRRLMTDLASWRPDVTYVRTTARQFVLAGRLARWPHVIEIQNDDIAEARGLSSSRLALARATRDRCLSSAAGLVFVAAELMNRPIYEGFTQRRTVIANGIDLSRVAGLPAPTHSGPPRLAFMGLPGIPWHGLEDVIDLAAIRPEWLFDLIGPTPGLLRALPNVICHGELTSERYLPILQQADAAISTLALHRNGMSEASPLKSREYLALGLPVIGGYADTDFPTGADFYLQVPNEGGAIVRNAAVVERFVDYWRGRDGRRVPRQAISRLDSTVKERARLAFLKQCAL